MSTLEAWDDQAPKAEISVSELKSLIANMRQLREKYDEAKRLSNEAHDKFREAEQLVINAMEATGQKRFNIPGMGTLSVVTKYQVTVPKDVEGKRQLFQYIRDNYGQDVLDEYRSINYQSLNSFYKQEADIAESEGREFNLPGVDDPTEKIETRWRADKK